MFRWIHRSDVNGTRKRFEIERIHQEENAAKNIHVSGASLVDYNRAGTALMEIVSHPCMHSADDALAYMTAIKQIMQYGGISSCDQEKGRCVRCKHLGSSDWSKKFGFES